MAERLVLEAVLLDAGGTMVRLDFETMAAIAVEAGAELSASALRRAEIAGRRRYDLSRAAPRNADAAPPTTLEDMHPYFAGMLSAAGVPESVGRVAVERWLARQAESGLWVRPMEGAGAALEALASLGLRSAVISNSDGRAEKHLIDCGLGGTFEFVIDSHRVGIEKPDPAIFRLALERLGVAPERALFVGDIRSVDEKGARAAGMHFVLLDPYGDYAAPGTHAIPGMERLAAWVSECFQVPGARKKPGAAGPESRGREDDLRRTTIEEGRT